MKHKSLKYYKNRADRLFSLWIRQRDAVNGICKCITCGSLHHWKKVHCGHFMSRRHGNTRYNERNAHAQCVSCNTFNQGQQFEYSLFLDKKYGRDTALVIKHLSGMECKRSWFDYMQIGDELLEKLKSEGFEIR